MTTVETVEQLRALYRPPGRVSMAKEIDHLDSHCRAFIAHSPLAVLATTDGAGRVDISPKGGQPGFVAVLDDQRLAVPDMAGNNRLDSFTNILKAPGVSLLFLVPGVGETLRVVGRGSVSLDPAVLDRCPVGELRPNVALLVEVDTAFLHCAKALRRSGAWDPDRWPDTGELPSAACMLHDHARVLASADEAQAALEESYRSSTWAMGAQPPGEL